MIKNFIKKSYKKIKKISHKIIYIYCRGYKSMKRGCAVELGVRLSRYPARMYLKDKRADKSDSRDAGHQKGTCIEANYVFAPRLPSLLRVPSRLASHD